MSNNKNKKVNKKRNIFKIIIPLLTLVVVLIIIGIFVTGRNLSRQETVEKVIREKFFSDNITMKKLEKIMDTPMIPNFMFKGKDSFLRGTPDKKVVKSANLSKYEMEQKKYVERIENKVEKNTTYTIEANNGDLYFNIRPWGFYSYSYDVAKLSQSLIKMSSYDIDKLRDSNDNQYEIVSYKAKVKSMQLLDKYIDRYDNPNEIKQFIFYFDGTKPADNQYFSLYLNLAGVTSEMAVDTPEEESEHEEFINIVINDAIGDKSLDEEDPLGI